MADCKKCLHIAVCGRYAATGGHVRECKHFATENIVGHKWIPTAEQLPESQKIVLVSAKEKIFGWRHILMAAHIGHHEATTEDYGWQEYEGDTEYDEENDCFWIPECWWEVNAVEGNENWILDSDYEVTHWMPLPEPPKEVE